MPRALRVKLDPVAEVSQEQGKRHVRGLTVAITQFGAGTTSAQRETPQPGTLTFFAQFFRQVRRGEPGESRTLLKVPGEILLESEDAPRFAATSESLDALAEEPLAEEPLESPDDPEPSSAARRFISLSFDSDTFSGFPTRLDLVLPSDIEDFHFAEVTAELAINGSTEAATPPNDVLDVPISVDSPSFVPAFEALISDDLREPIAELAVRYLIEGAPNPKTTDQEGMVRFFEPSSTVADLELPSPAELKQLLKPRWDKIRGGPRRDAAIANVQRLVVRDDMDTTVPVAAGEPVAINLCPNVERANLLRFFFDTNKTFFLPDLPEATDGIAEFYERNKPGKLLVVGHADTAGSSDYNDKLSLERAEAVLAYLEDDVDGWLKWYGADVIVQKRWGATEDAAMIGALPDADKRDPGESAVTFFQRTRGLKVDGVAGPKTRRALVQEYFSLDKATLPPEIKATVHGCGEHFTESHSADGTADADDRRAELFFFDPDLGIQPAPSGKISKAGSGEYPEWVRRSKTSELASGGLGSVAIKLLDAMNEPLRDAPYELTVGGERRVGHSDLDGFVVEENIALPNRCTLKWGYPESPGQPEGPPDLIFTRDILLDYADADQADPTEGARRRLSNLGYTGTFNEQVNSFQTDFSLSLGPLDQVTVDEIKRIHDTV